jgi:glutamyl-tRNA reductase
MNIKQFYIAGINYKKTDTAVRGKFAINTDQYYSLLQKAAVNGLQELVVLSTCNRTEIYGLANSSNDLIELLCNETSGNAETFKSLAYIKHGWDAVDHLFSVAAGLDSQILGDYEIVGQLKQAAKIARDHNMVGTFLERLVNMVLQSSKAIKSGTQLSSGTVSVSFAAIQYLKEFVPAIKHKKIALLGTGKIGSNTCKNLVDYLETTNITLINRTEEKAEELAASLGLQSASFSNAQGIIQSADIIIVATNAENPVILKEDVAGSKEKILIDLSIPNNIDPSVKTLPHITLVNVDDLSKINDATLQNRMDEVPKAKNIIDEHIAEFCEWYAMRKNVPALKAVKQRLMTMHQCSLYLSSGYNDICTNPDEASIQKVVNNMAVKMKQQQLPGCCYIEAINDFISSNAN